MTELCKLARQCTTDKALFYTPLYHELLKDRRDIKKVLEFGIGYPATMQNTISRMGLTEYKTGASLYMWREYLPLAEIYALDNKPEIFIHDERIHSFYCDQASEESFRKVIGQIGADFDLIVEDGSHVPEDQIRSVKMLMPILKTDGIYIIEDVNPTPEFMAQLPANAKLKEFCRADLPEGSNTAAVVVIRND